MSFLDNDCLCIIIQYACLDVKNWFPLRLTNRFFLNLCELYQNPFITKGLDWSIKNNKNTCLKYLLNHQKIQNNVTKFIDLDFGISHLDYNILELFLKNVDIFYTCRFSINESNKIAMKAFSKGNKELIKICIIKLYFSFNIKYDLIIKYYNFDDDYITKYIMCDCISIKPTFPLSLKIIKSSLENAIEYSKISCFYIEKDEKILDLLLYYDDITIINNLLTYISINDLIELLFKNKCLKSIKELSCIYNDFNISFNKNELLKIYIRENNRKEIQWILQHKNFIPYKDINNYLDEIYKSGTIDLFHFIFAIYPSLLEEILIVVCKNKDIITLKEFIKNVKIDIKIKQNLLKIIKNKKCKSIENLINKIKD